MGFLAGFGESLNRSAELQQQAKLAQQQELTRANLKLAELYLGSPNLDDQAKGLAIMADPTVPFRTDKDHPKKKEAQNILQTLGGGAAGRGAATSGTPGMATMLGADQSPFANMYVPGEGGPDQGGPQPAPPMPPPPPLPPQPAAQTTAPPASMGGTLPPQAAMGGAPVPQGPPAMPAPPPGPPPPPPQLAAAAAPPPPPDEIAAAIQAFQGAPPLPMPPLSHTAQQAYYAADLQRGQALQRALALKAAGASPEEVRAVLAGREGTQVITTGMKGAVTQAEGEANRGSRERIAGDRLKAVQAGVEARIAEAKARREQDWAKHKESLSLGYSRLAAGQSRTAERAETARIAKLQTKGEEVRNFADNGISGIENLRGMHQLYAEADGPKEKIIAWERFADAAAGEAARITAAMTGMGVKGVRQTEARVRAAVKEITTTHKSLIPGYPPIPLLSPGEIDLRLDNIRHLVEDAERQARAGIEESAAKPPKPGESPLTPVPTRARAGEGPPTPPQGLQGGAAPKPGDTKTFPNGNKARWNGKGWVLVP